MSDGSRAVILLNRGSSETTIGFKWSEIGYPNHLQAKVRDLWAHQDAGSFAEGYKANVPSHGVVMVRVSP